MEDAKSAEDKSNENEHACKVGDQVHAHFMGDWRDAKVTKTSGKCVHVQMEGVLFPQCGCRLIPGHLPIPVERELEEESKIEELPNEEAAEASSVAPGTNAEEKRACPLAICNLNPT